MAEILNHKTVSGFRKLLRELPSHIQKLARKNYLLMLVNPNHPSLHLKKMQGYENRWSVRVGLNYRAVGYKDGNEISWYWIGTHEQFNNLTK